MILALVLTSLSLTASSSAAGCGHELLAGAYRRAQGERPNLFRYLLMHPRAVTLARRASLPLTRPPWRGPRAVVEFNARLGRALNENGIEPLAVLRAMAKGRAGALGIIDDLAARAAALGLVVAWQDLPIDACTRSKTGVHLNVRFTAGPFGLAYTLLAFAHEVMHEPTDGFKLSSRSESEAAFVERIRTDQAREELRVRVLDRVTYRRLRRADLDLPYAALDGLTRRLWRARAERRSEEELLAMVKARGTDGDHRGLSLWWAELQMRGDLEDVRAAFDLGDEAFANRLDEILERSPLRPRFVNYVTRLMWEAELRGLWRRPSPGQDLLLERWRARERTL